MEREKEQLEEEQALQFEELAEENSRKLAEAILTEVQVTDEFHETLSRISKHSKQTTSQRMSEWVNEVNEPDSVSRQPQSNIVGLNNVLGSFNTAVIPESNDGVQMRQATLEMRSLAEVNIGLGQTQIPPIRISSDPTIPRPNSTPPSVAAVNPLPNFQLPTVNTTSNTVSSVTVPVVNQQPLTMFSQVQPSVAPATTRTQVNIPMNHVIPNLSAWTFPAPSSFPAVHATVPQPVRGQVTLPSTNASPIVTTTGIFAPVIPIQSGRNTFYCNPLAATIPTTTFPIPPSTTAPVNVPFLTFPTTV